MKIALITRFPEIFESVTDFGISGRAVINGLLDIVCFNPRDLTDDTHRTVDDRPYGGGPGMVMLIEPLRKAICKEREWTGPAALVVYLSPQRNVLDQASVNRFVQKQNLILITGSSSPEPPANVFFAVSKAVEAAALPCKRVVASFAKRVFKSFIFLSLIFWISETSLSVNIFKNLITSLSSVFLQNCQ